jgi:hypothetical protein
MKSATEILKTMEILQNPTNIKELSTEQRKITTMLYRHAKTTQDVATCKYRLNDRGIEDMKRVRDLINAERRMSDGN